MRRTRLPDPPVNGRLGYPLGFVAAVAVTIVIVAAHATSHPLWSVAALAVTTAAVAALTALSAALATAAVSWALHAGFVLGRRGELQFSVASAGAAVVLVTVAVIATTSLPIWHGFTDATRCKTGPRRVRSHGGVGITWIGRVGTR